jgi:hypothetical protein
MSSMAVKWNILTASERAASLREFEFDEIRTELYRAMKPKLLEWHTLSSHDNLDELATLFSAFAKKPIHRQTLLSVLDSTSNPGSSVISFDQLSKLFVAGVRATDTREILEAVLDDLIFLQKKDKKQLQPEEVEILDQQSPPATLSTPAARVTSDPNLNPTSNDFGSSLDHGYMSLVSTIDRQGGHELQKDFDLLRWPRSYLPNNHSRDRSYMNDERFCLHHDADSDTQTKHSVRPATVSKQLRIFHDHERVISRFQEGDVIDKFHWELLSERVHTLPRFEDLPKPVLIGGSCAELLGLVSG